MALVESIGLRRRGSWGGPDLTRMVFALFSYGASSLYSIWGPQATAIAMTESLFDRFA